MSTMIRYTDKEMRERPFTKEDVIATTKAILRDRSPKGEQPAKVCLNSWGTNPGPYNYPEFNDQVYMALEASWYYQYR